MSIEQAAIAAGMAPEYLRYVEDGASPNVSQASLMRIAAALGVSAAELAGAGPAERVKQESDGHPILTEMSRAECRDRLLGAHLGRVVFDEPGRGPVAIPAEYTMDGNDVIIRAVKGSSVAAHAHGRVSFDVDHFDGRLAGGWSVLLTGMATPISNPADLRHLTGRGTGRPADAFIRLAACRVTGRRITSGSEPS